MKNTHKHVPLSEVEEKVVHRIVDSRDKVAIRFPLAFGLATSFGLVATFYGFEGLINRIPLLLNNPWLLLVVGIVVLLITGTAYKKLN